MDRRDKLISMIKPSGKGIEIGPSFNPIVPKHEGFQTKIVDHVDAAGLREKYGSDPNVKEMVDNIEDVDFVWREGSLVELVGGCNSWGFIVASHVIEHVPNFIRFLQDCEKLLSDTGVLALAVPDKRYCFDYFRPYTTMGHVLDAYFEGRDRHTAGTLYDHVALAACSSGAVAWGQEQRSNFGFSGSPAVAWEALMGARRQTTYTDAHAWQFTPSSFRLIISDLNELGLVQLKEVAFFETEGCEFIIGLSKVGPGNMIGRLELAKRTLTELAEVIYRNNKVQDGIGDAVFNEARSPSSKNFTYRLKHAFLSDAQVKLLSINGIRKLIAGRPLQQ